jgi:hypothetical protein
LWGDNVDGEIKSDEEAKKKKKALTGKGDSLLTKAEIEKTVGLALVAREVCRRTRSRSRYTGQTS